MSTKTDAAAMPSSIQTVFNATMTEMTRCTGSFCKTRVPLPPLRKRRSDAVLMMRNPPRMLMLTLFLWTFACNVGPNVGALELGHAVTTKEP